VNRLAAQVHTLQPFSSSLELQLFSDVRISVGY